jgi:hypothetical protein
VNRRVGDGFDYFLGCVWSGWGRRSSTRGLGDMAFHCMGSERITTSNMPLLGTHQFFFCIVPNRDQYRAFGYHYSVQTNSGVPLLGVARDRSSPRPGWPG